jgi:superfamily II DNA/RNA helicase
MEAEALTADIFTMQNEPEAAASQAAALRPDEAAPDAAILNDLALDDTALDDTALDDPALDDTVLDAAELKTFRDFGIAESVCAALEAEGITTTFPIQTLTLPIALAGHDVIGQARTGTGKTLAFGVPILQHLKDTPGDKPAAPRALIVVPTRELAIQVGDDLRIAGSRSGVNVVTLYGGRAYEPQIEALATVDIVVGTPGRLLDLARQGHLNLSRIRALVLDEADKMLDLGFLPDVEKILKLTPQQRQTMLFSATMPGEVVTLARRHLSQPIHIRAEQHDEPALVPSTEQHVFRAHQMDKIEVLARVLQASGRGLTIVFCRTRRACDQVATALTTRGFAAAAVHGDLGQSQRERAMRAFRTGKVDVLVATDVAARGLDVEDVTHVVNHECPEDEKAYLHRIGRTGRAGKAGVAVTFVDWHDIQRWKLINEALHLGHPEPVETYSTSDHLFSALGIPAGTRGTLPRGMRGRLGLEAEDLEDIGETGRVRSPAGGRGERGARERGSRDHSGRGRVGSDRGGRAVGTAGDDGRRETGQRGRRIRRRTRAGISPGGPDGQREPTATGQRAANGSATASGQDGQRAANGSATASGQDGQRAANGSVAASGQGVQREPTAGGQRAAGESVAANRQRTASGSAPANGPGSADETGAVRGKSGRRRRRSPRPRSARGTGQPPTASHEDG